MEKDDCDRVVYVIEDDTPQQQQQQQHQQQHQQQQQYQQDEISHHDTEDMKQKYQMLQQQHKLPHHVPNIQPLPQLPPLSQHQQSLPKREPLPQITEQEYHHESVHQQKKNPLFDLAIPQNEQSTSQLSALHQQQPPSEQQSTSDKIHQMKTKDQDADIGISQQHKQHQQQQEQAQPDSPPPRLQTQQSLPLEKSSKSKDKKKKLRKSKSEKGFLGKKTPKQGVDNKAFVVRSRRLYRSNVCVIDEGFDEDDDDDSINPYVLNDSENTSPFQTRMAKVGPSPDLSREETMDYDAQSLHYNDQAVTVETQGSKSSYKDKRQREIEFMQDMRRRECRCYIERQNDDNLAKEKKDRLCSCRYKYSEHSDQAKKNEKQGQWDPKVHTRKITTNAFGEMEFVGYGDKVAKYVRVEMDTKMPKLLNLLQKTWEIEKPTLLISVTGGAKKCNLNSRLREVFKRGLKKAAQSPGAWIVTGGTNAGVMKLVGEAVRDHDMMSKRSLVTIGIAPWGCVRNKECLTSKTNHGNASGHYPAHYTIQGDDKNGETFLDPNHSHFILVDNGTQHTFATEIDLRTKLEEAISKEKTDSSAGAVSVPVCLLVLDGGVGTLETVVSALKQGTPTVVIKGSGKAADILAYAVQNVKEQRRPVKDNEGNEMLEIEHYLEDSVKDEIREKVANDFGEDNITRNVEWVVECSTNVEKISVFELDSKDSAKEVDLAILKALLKANKSNVSDQLRLALCWNRIDVAKMEIFTDDQNWEPGTLDDAMMSALILDRVEFVQLFLDHGVKLKDFLTEKRLLELYNNIPDTSILRKLLRQASKERESEQDIETNSSSDEDRPASAHSHRNSIRRVSTFIPTTNNNSSKFNFQDVDYVIRMLLGDFFKPGYPTNLDGDKAAKAAVENGYKNLSDQNPCGDESLSQSKQYFSEAQQLFIWSVLLNRHEMSFKFWMMAKEASAAALFAMSVLSKMKKYTVDCEVQRKLEINAEEYEQRAIEVLNACYATNEVKTQDNLIRNMPNWGSTSSCLLAYHSDNKKFLAQTACQSLLNNKWRGELDLSNKYFTILLCTLMPLLIPFLIKFRGPSKSHGSTLINRKKNKAQIAERAAQEQTDSDGEEVKSSHCLSYIRDFYQAPIVKFNCNVISYFIFLALYSYIMLIKLEDKTFHWVEILLIIWVFSIFEEEIRQLIMMYSFTFKGKLKYYFHDQWNILDLITISLFIVGMVFRFFMTDETMAVARILLNINLIAFFLRVLHIFSVNPKLGPMLVMITDMLKDLMWFVCILLVFVFAYAIASEAILYPNSELNWKLLYYLPRKAYWQMYGEIMLEEIEVDSSQCTNDPAIYNDYDQLRCPSDSGRYFVPILLGIYIMLTSVMLLNLLIAMFSYTFQKIQDRSDMHWCYQRFSLVHEYVEKPLLPPPLIFFSHMFLLVSFLYRCLKRTDRNKLCCLHCHRCGKDDKSSMTYKRCCQEDHSSSAFRNNFEEDVQKHLIQWENIIADNHFSEKRDPTSLEGKVASCNKKIDALINRFDTMQESQSQGGVGGGIAAPLGQTSAAPTVQAVTRSFQPVITTASVAQLAKRMEGIENQLTQFSKSFEWIMRSMEENSMASQSPRPQLKSIEEKRKEARLATIERHRAASMKVERHISNKLRLQYHSRCSPYPGTKEKRFPVPDEKVDWDVPFPEYRPSTYTSQHILDMPKYADRDLLSLPNPQRSLAISFNAIDNGINRVSLVKPYLVEDGLPINPHGRTGMKGRGSLGRWGPNMCGDPIVTRWKLKADGSCSMVDGKPELEYVSVQRKDNNMWAIPGSICEEDEEPWDILHTDFKEEVLGAKLKDPQEQALMNEKLDLLSKGGKEIYKGYADDPRNTDNAWLETRVINYHDDDGGILKNFNFRAGEDLQAVSWQTVNSQLTLHGGHAYFLKLVAKEHGASF